MQFNVAGPFLIAHAQATGMEVGATVGIQKPGVNNNKRLVGDDLQYFSAPGMPLPYLMQEGFLYHRLMYFSEGRTEISTCQGQMCFFFAV